MSEETNKRVRKHPSPPPLPLAKRTCRCGCRNQFQPKRNDQIYLNSQHANFAYNHGKRKLNMQKIKQVNAIIQQNDLILSKYFKGKRLNRVQCSKTSLAADGFNFDFFTGRTTSGEFALYNFCYQLHVINDTTIIEIQKIA